MPSCDTGGSFLKVSEFVYITLFPNTTPALQSCEFLLASDLFSTCSIILTFVRVVQLCLADEPDKLLCGVIFFSLIVGAVCLLLGVWIYILLLLYAAWLLLRYSCGCMTYEKITER